MFLIEKTCSLEEAIGRSLRARRCPFERQRGVLFERRSGRLEEQQHLGGVERERLEARGDGAEARD